MPVITQADAVAMLQPIADALGIDKVELAERFASAWAPRREALARNLWGTNLTSTRPRRYPPPPNTLPTPTAQEARGWAAEARKTARERRLKHMPRFGLKRCKHCNGRPILKLNLRGYAMACSGCGARTTRAWSRSLIFEVWDKSHGIRFRGGIVCRS